jgi:uncharacterized protein (DUF433 family)
MEKVAEIEEINVRLTRLEEEVRELREAMSRKAKEHPLITRKPTVCGGEPIIVGTRTPVRAIVEHVRLGDSPEGILEHLPYLTLEKIHAALEYYRDNKREIDVYIELNEDEDFWKAWVKSSLLPSIPTKM